jgi:opacity protein-like surface antigen
MPTKPANGLPHISCSLSKSNRSQFTVQHIALPPPMDSPSQTLMTARAFYKRMAGASRRVFNVLISLAMLMLISSPGFSQDCCPRGETFVGYSFLSADAKTDHIISPDFDSRYAMTRTGYGVPLNGFNQAINLTQRIALLFDYSHNHKELTIDHLDLGQSALIAAKTNIDTNLFLFGARLNNRSEGSNFFGEAMIGGFNRRINARDAMPGNAVKFSNTDLAFALGGGADMAVGKHIAIRLFQVDYILARGKADVPAGDSRLSNNFRFQVGVVFRWGHTD